ncbi:MAG: PQQ-binding-like beta-propeller repeat protein [Pirellulales bacterium]
MRQLDHQIPAPEQGTFRYIDWFDELGGQRESKIKIKIKTKFKTLAFTLLAFSCLPIAAANGAEDAVVSPFGHEFPPIFAIQNDWNEFQEGAPRLKVVQALLQKDAVGKLVVPQGETTFTSVWVAVNRWLRQRPDILAALRTEQNAAAARQLFVAQRSGNPDRLMTIYRTYPWADAVHLSLLDTGEQLLRRGKPQLALRCFQDVLARSEDVKHRARAQAGLWLAAAHSASSADEISAIVHDADSAARYPWFGQQLSAKEIQAQLTAGMKPPAPPAEFNALSIRTIQLPEDPPWLGAPERLSPTSHELLLRHKVQPVVSSQGTVVAGPCLVAWYADGALDAPTWSKIATMDISPGNPPKPPFDPLVAEGRIFVRCGSDLAPADQARTRFVEMRNGATINISFLEHLAAFDQNSGKKIWSTGDDPDWTRLFVVNAPVYSDGRLYLLARIKGGQVLIGGKAPIFLVIADAATGRILQQRELAAYHTIFQGHKPKPGEPRPPRIFKKLNLSADAYQRGEFFAHNQLNMYGDRLTIHDGAVYTSTAMGVAARCDARDALVEWVVTYPQLAKNSTGVLVPSGWPHAWDAPYVIRRRHSVAPLVGDEVVVFSPRDTVAIFAVDRETGVPLWQKTEIEDEAAGQPDQAVAVKNSIEKFNQGPADKHVHDGTLEALGLFGDSVLVTFDLQLAALEATTGKLRWTRTLDAPVERPIKVIGTTLYLATGTDLLEIDGATGEIVGTRALAPLRTDNGFVFDDKGLIIVLPGKYGITHYGTPGVVGN